MGSAGAKIAAVIDGAVDAYVHAGGQYEWDSAAPVAVAVATGLHASRIDGTTLEYNQPDPRLPDLVVCRKALAPRLLAAISASAGLTATTERLPPTMSRAPVPRLASGRSRGREHLHHA